MRLLTHAELQALDDEALLATAECHGLEVEGLSPAEALEELVSFLEDFSTLAAEG
jgi:hypothetical protein